MTAKDIEMCALAGEIGGLHEAIAAKLKEDLIGIDWKANDGHCQS
jgi:hypothetical protein